MNQQEWSICTDSRPMLAVLASEPSVSKRKLRLFAVAVARRPHSLLSPAELLALDQAEAFADTRIREADLPPIPVEHDWLGGPIDLVYSTVQPASVFGIQDARRVSTQVAWYLASAAFPDADFDHDAWLGAAEVREEELATHASLLRCIFGPLQGGPFRPARNDAVDQLAVQIYTNCDFSAESLLELADALQEAGCHDDVILGHLRQPDAVHVRGCFALDWILGKET